MPLAAPFIAAMLSGCGDATPPDTPRVLVLGMDGVDPKLLGELMAAGRVPNFSKLAAQGTFLPLETAAPPQSPVAWSNFIVGADPGTHNIYDFIHRHTDSEAGPMPYSSMADVEPPSRDWAIPLGRWQIPLFGPTPVSLRRGVPFWEDLVAHGVQTTLYRMPTDYPPPDIGGRNFRCLCGMGTPDLLGSNGEFTFFTPDAPIGGQIVAGGRLARLRMRKHRGVARLEGPDNFLRKPDEFGSVPELVAELEVVRDPEADVVKIDSAGEVVVLAKGDWSDWTPVEFETGIPGSMILGAMQLPTKVNAMVRFYVKNVHPKTQIYVTPINIDPLAQVTAVGAPGGFPKEVAEAAGRFYTTGMPEDNKALRAKALTEDEFLAQVALLVEERTRQYRYALENFHEGLLFFYFGHTDQLAHIFWRDRDPGHPAYDPEEGAKYGTVIEDTYVEMDGLLGEAMDVLRDGDTLIVMSDHGFTSFRRGVNLNRWLIDKGLMATRPGVSEVGPYGAGVDWSATKAYALGINGLYINQSGREAFGIVPPAERRMLLEQLRDDLLAMRDDDGAQVIDHVYIVEDDYPDGDPEVAPDILVGYADTYRASWGTAEGAAPPGLFEDNHDRWSGDHCVAHEIVPGILVTNRTLDVDDPDLTDLAPTLLNLFGIDKPPAMTGRVLFGP